MIAEEIGAVQEMVTKGLNPKPKLLALQRQAAEIEGMRGQNIAKIEASVNNLVQRLKRAIAADTAIVVPRGTSSPSASGSGSRSPRLRPGASLPQKPVGQFLVYRVNRQPPFID